MDVVYVHKQKASDEIKWSIKSVRENLKHGNIYVVGDDPGVDGVIVVQPKNSRWARLGKYHDQANKYLTACQHPDISEEFLAMNDDFFIMKPWEPEYYNRGTLGEHIESRSFHDLYRRSLNSTKLYLEFLGKQTLSFELHTPMLFQKDKLRDLIESLEMNRSPAYQLRSLYGNIYQVPAALKEDVKNVENYVDSSLLSTTEDYFARKPIGQFIREQLS